MELNTVQLDRVGGRGLRGRGQGLTSLAEFGSASSRSSQQPTSSGFGNVGGGNMALLGEVEQRRRAPARGIEESTTIGRRVAPLAQVVVTPPTNFPFDVDELELVLASKTSSFKPKTSLSKEQARNLELERELGCHLTSAAPRIAPSGTDGASGSTSSASSYSSYTTAPSSPLLYDGIVTHLANLSLNDRLLTNNEGDANKTLIGSSRLPSATPVVDASVGALKNWSKSTAAGIKDSKKKVDSFSSVVNAEGSTDRLEAAASAEERAIEKRDVACGDDTPVPSLAQARAELVAKMRAQEQEEDRARFEETVLCKVCMTVRYNTMVLPCCHLWGCEGCVKIVNECAICRNPIQDRLRLTTVDDLTEQQKQTVRNNMRRMINENFLQQRK